MLRWLRRLMVSMFGSRASTEEVNLTLIASQKARERSAKLLREVRPQIDRAKRLIAEYQLDEAVRVKVEAPH